MSSELFYSPALVKIHREGKVQEIGLRHRGIEPRPFAWKAKILTIRPMALESFFARRLSSRVKSMQYIDSSIRVAHIVQKLRHLQSAPHLGGKFWALADRNAVFVMDFMPQSTRGYLSSFWLRTGRFIDWSLLGIKVFGAPLVFAPIDGPIHKRAPIAEQGYFLGYQWPAMLVLRISDGKVINVSRQKVRVYESAYIGPSLHWILPCPFLLWGSGVFVCLSCRLQIIGFWLILV